MRKPLYPSEENMPEAQITVTGAESYIGGAVIQRLLASGHIVHATWRGKNPETVKHLLAMTNAHKKLKFFEADLLVPGAFAPALSGSRFLIHIASPCDMNPPKNEAYERLIKPAVEGVENVLTSALSTPTLEKVVLTSSVGAVVGDRQKIATHHLHSEADWNQAATEHYHPYNRSKTLAEQKAYEIASQPNCHWSLATILPAIVLGPPVGKIRCASTIFMAKLLNGFYYPFGTPVGMPFVDVDDVAAAHSLALAVPEAIGRFVVCNTSMLLPDFVNLLQPEYASYKLPYIFWIPYFILWLVLYFRIIDKGFDLDLLTAFYKRPPLFDNSKSRKILSLNYIGMKETACDMAGSIVALGFLSKT